MNNKKSEDATFSIQITWCVDDVLQIRPDLTTSQARIVLEKVKHDHDANFGICWDTLTDIAAVLFPINK